MINKYLSKLKLFFDANQKRMITFPRITHSFSVVGHQTFGHFLTDADPVMAQLQKLNKYFAQDNHTADSLFQRFITSILRQETLEAIGNRIKIEDLSIREFNIFEVVAYCLFVELQQEFKNIKVSAKIEDQIYTVKRENYFTYFQKVLDELKKIEENRLKQTVTILPTLKNHILDCQMKFAKKQIHRRLYQMCKYSAEQQIKKKNYNDLKYLIYVFIQKIDLQYSMMSLDLINGFYQDLSNKQNHIYDSIYSAQKHYHPFIAQEIKSLFADDIEKGYYSPLLILQDGYKAGLGLQKTDSAKINKQLPTLVQTFSFIPTFVTTKLNNWMYEITSNIFVSALKDLGKSSNLLLLTILKGYTDQPKFVLIPQFTYNKMRTLNSLHMCIVQTLWKSLSKQNFIKVEFWSKEIMKKEQQKTGDSSTHYAFYKQAIKQLLDIIKGNTKGLLLDQFSTFIDELYKSDQQKQIYSQKTKLQLQFIDDIFDFVYNNKGYSVICCSSRAYQSDIISRKLNLIKQSINLKVLSLTFTDKQSNHLFMVWLKRHLQCLIYQERLDKELIQIQLSNQMTQQKQKIWQQKFEKLQNVKKKLEIISKLINENQKQIMSGQMSVIKKSAEQISIKLVQNPGIQINEGLINAIQKEQKIKYYKALITNWLQISEKDNIQLLRRKQIIRAVLKGKSLDQLQFLYDYIIPQIPKFLFYQNQKIIKAELFQIMQQLWSQVKQLCVLSEDQWKSLFQLILKHKYQASVEAGINFLIQLYIYDVFEQEKNIEEGCLLKEIFRIIYPTLPQDQRQNIKKINIKKVIKQKNGFQQIAKQIDQQLKIFTGKNSVFMVPLSAHFSGCDQYLIKLKNKNEKNQLQTKEASAIHIQIGVNKTKAKLEQLVFNVLSKQENCQNYVNKQFNKKKQKNKQYALENEKNIKEKATQLFLKNHKQFKEFKSKMQEEFQKKGISLKSYDILVITGHKANQLGKQWKNQHNIKVLNFKNLSSQSLSVKCVKNLFNFYQQLLLKKEQEKKEKKKKEKQQKQKQKQGKKKKQEKEKEKEKKKKKKKKEIRLKQIKGVQKIS